MNEDEPLDRLHIRVKRLIEERKIQEVDDILATVYPDTLSPAVLVAVLRVTFSVKNHLPSRPELFEIIKADLTERGNFEEYLLVGLD
jgi:hypothetical protein